MDERLKEIKERLAAAKLARDGLLGPTETYDAADALIANAPADIAWLIALVEEMAPHAVEGASEYGEPRELVEKFARLAGTAYS